MKERSQPILGVGSSSQWGLASSFTLPLITQESVRLFGQRLDVITQYFLPHEGERLFKGLKG